MGDDLRRSLIFTEKCIDAQHNSHIILRKNSTGCEIDIKLRGFDCLENFLRTTDHREVYILNSSEDDLNISPSHILNSGVSLMNEEKYWIAHEYFEKLWKYYKEPKSSFFHSIVLLCVAMVHHQMGRESTKFRIFNNAREEMSRFLDISFMDQDFYYPLPQRLIEDITIFGKKLISQTGFNLNGP